MTTKLSLKVYWRERGELMWGIICPDHMALIEKEHSPIWNKGEKFPLKECMICHMAKKMNQDDMAIT